NISLRSSQHLAHNALSLHDALPISPRKGEVGRGALAGIARAARPPPADATASRAGSANVACVSTIVLSFSLSRMVASGSRAAAADRKSTRLNFSHSQISYAVFCLKK